MVIHLDALDGLLGQVSTDVLTDGLHDVANIRPRRVRRTLHETDGRTDEKKDDEKTQHLDAPTKPTDSSDVPKSKTDTPT